MTRIWFCEYPVDIISIVEEVRATIRVFLGRGNEPARVPLRETLLIKKAAKQLKEIR